MKPSPDPLQTTWLVRDQGCIYSQAIFFFLLQLLDDERDYARRMRRRAYDRKRRAALRGGR